MSETRSRMYRASRERGAPTRVTAGGDATAASRPARGAARCGLSSVFTAPGARRFENALDPGAGAKTPSEDEESSLPPSGDPTPPPDSRVLLYRACAARAAAVFAPGVFPPRPGVMAAREASAMSASTVPSSSDSRRLGLS